MKPLTKYAKSSDINIAYQVVGKGSVDLIYVPGWVSNIDAMWEDPKISYFLNRLIKFTRLILFDKRGTGLSDRVSALSTLEERMEDITCVMDAADSEKAILFGHSEGGTVSSLFAATYPQRTVALISFGIFAKRRYSNDYPWAPTFEEREKFYKVIIEGWGDGQRMDLDRLMPSMAHDLEYIEIFAAYLRSAASPGAALALARMNTEADITHILPFIKVPALVIHRTNDLESKVEEGKYIANLIPGAKFVELPGEDHLFWTGDAFSVLAEIEEFITGKRPKRKAHQISKRIKKNIEKIMSENFQNSLKLEDFAKLYGKSLSAFKRDFRKSYNTTPSNWLMNKRLEYAKTLLLSTDLQVNEIAYESGFKNNSHFIQSFNKKYQLPPLQFKTKNLKAI